MILEISSVHSNKEGETQHVHQQPAIKVANH